MCVRSDHVVHVRQFRFILSAVVSDTMCFIYFKDQSDCCVKNGRKKNLSIKRLMFYDSSIIYSTLNSYCKPSTILGPEEIAVNITK